MWQRVQTALAKGGVYELEKRWSAAGGGGQENVLTSAAVIDLSLNSIVGIVAKFITARLLSAE